MTKRRATKLQDALQEHVQTTLKAYQELRKRASDRQDRQALTMAAQRSLDTVVLALDAAAASTGGPATPALCRVEDPECDACQ